MNDLIERKSHYKLFISKWEIAIMLEAGYRELYENEDCKKYIKVYENIYFSTAFLPYPGSVVLTNEEIEAFCNGLRMVGKLIIDKVDHKPCLIQLQSIQFSDCNMQKEALVVSAIKWASEIFDFPMPMINVTFDDTVKPCGKYVFDFSNMM